MDWLDFLAVQGTLKSLLQHHSSKASILTRSYYPVNNDQKWKALSFTSHRICCSFAHSYLTLRDPMDCSTPCFPVLHPLLEPAQTHVSWVGDAIQPSHPLLSPSPPAFNLSSIRVFSDESILCIRWPKYWSFSFSISPSNEYSGLISFRMDWLDLLAVQGTLKSLFPHHSTEAWILWRSGFLMVQISYPYMILEKP